MATTTLLIGLGKGGSALLPYLLADPQFDLVGVCDTSHEAVGRPLAQRCRVPFHDDPAAAVQELMPQMVIDATGDPSLPSTLYEVRPAGTSVVTGEAARLLWEMLSAMEGQRRSELRYDRLISDMQSGLVVVQNSKVRFVNRAFCQMVGYRDDQILGRPYADLLDPEFRRRDIERHLARISGEGAVEEYETRVMNNEGQPLNALVRARLSDWDGRPASLLIMTDVTQLRELQRERERFFRFMVHQLRAPLSPLVTAVSLFRNPKVLEERARLEGILSLVIRSVDRLRSFVDDFLELSKLDVESLAVHRDEVDLQAVISEVVESQLLLAQDKGLELRVEPWSPFPIRGDTFAIRTVVQNLVNNAVKYTTQGRVTVSVSREGEAFILRVRDTGIGLTEEERTHLFQEFGRIRRMAGVKGSGLGLALVKKLTDACGGEARAESEGRDKGSVFSVRFPCHFGEDREEQG